MIAINFMAVGIRNERNRTVGCAGNATISKQLVYSHDHEVDLLYFHVYIITFEIKE